jgi:siroheme synthase-like protein
VTQPAQFRAFLPLGIALGGRRCLVVGGGAVGTRKAATLARAGASVTVVAPTVTEELAAQIASGGVRWIEGPFRDEYLEGVFLAVAATSDATLNATVAAAAEHAGALACDASSGQSSQVIFGALFDYDGTMVAVFTDGRDPARARDTRDRIAAHLAPGRPSR